MRLLDKDIRCQDANYVSGQCETTLSDVNAKLECYTVYNSCPYSHIHIIPSSLLRNRP